MASDLVWQFLTDDGLLRIGNNNSYLVKSKRNGGLQLSRDPLNLTNKNSRKVWTYHFTSSSFGCEVNILS
jgi:large subunit ribosomal protein L28e